MSNELRTSLQIQNNVSTNAVIQDLVEPYAKSQNKNNVSDYENLDKDNEENNFTLLMGAKNRQEIVTKTRELTRDSLEKHDMYETHLNRKYITDERKTALVMEHFTSLKNRKQVKTFDEYEKLLGSDPAEKKFINDKIDDERMRVFEEKSAKRSGSGLTQELLLQIGTGSNSSETTAYDPLTEEEHLKVAKDTIKFVDREFHDNIKIISSVFHKKETIDHSQTLYTAIDDKGRLNSRRGIFDAMQKYNKRHGLAPFKNRDYKGSFKAFIGVIDDYQRERCKDYGYDQKYDFTFAERGSVRKARKGKSLVQMKKQREKEMAEREAKVTKREEEQAKIAKEQAKKDKELAQREDNLNTREGQAYLDDIQRKKRDKALDKREQEMQQRKQQLDKREAGVNNYVVNFRKGVLVALYPQMDNKSVNTMAVDDVVKTKNKDTGAIKKETVVSHFVRMMKYYSTRSAEKTKRLFKAVENIDWNARFGSDSTKVAKPVNKVKKQVQHDDDLEM
nr:hypothetical protein [Lactiplantibacillus plantarum]